MNAAHSQPCISAFRLGRLVAKDCLALDSVREPERFEIDGRKTGCLYEDDFARYCFLGNIVPRDIKASRPEQARMVFEAFARALDRHGFKFTEVARTWFFIDHILDWYGEFNAVRTGFFNKAGVFKKTVPASTGVGMGNSGGAALVGNAFAVQPKNGRIRIRAVPSPLQPSAQDYQSSFSRAVELVYPGQRRLLVSGTSSIGRKGETVFKDDIAAQIGHTLGVVGALLRSRDLDWKNVFRGVAYLQHPDYPRYFREYCRKHKLAGLNPAIARADLCRPDLLFEIEVDALLTAN